MRHSTVADDRGVGGTGGGQADGARATVPADRHGGGALSRDPRSLDGGCRVRHGHDGRRRYSRTGHHSDQHRQGLPVLRHHSRQPRWQADINDNNPLQGDPADKGGARRDIHSDPGFDRLRGHPADDNRRHRQVLRDTDQQVRPPGRHDPGLVHHRDTGLQGRDGDNRKADKAHRSGRPR